MSSFSIKKLETTEPLNLYSDLDKSIEFGEDYATSMQDHDIYGKVYYLGGLEVYNLNTANLSEETIARFYNALDSGNVYYAVFPNDQRKGRLPLVLNKKTRAFLETLPELINNKEVKWYLYQLPGDIDPDNNERRGSDFVTDDDEKEIVLSYSEVEEHIANNGFVKEQEKEDNIFVSEEEKKDDDDDSTENENQPTEHTSKDDKEEVSNNEQPKEQDSDTEVNTEEASDKQMDEFEKMMYEDQFEENNNDREYEEDVNYKEVFSQPNKDHSTQNNDKHRQDKDEQNSNQTNDIDFANMNNQPNETSKDNVPESERALISNRTKQYIQLPSIVQEIIDDISLPMFTEYPTNGVYNVTSNTMKKEINDSNERIKELVNSIKREASQMYRDYMYKSYISITRELDTENGNDNIKNSYEKYVNDKNQLNEKFDQDINEKKQELEELFYGQRYKDYQDKVKAQIREWYEEEYYEKDVLNPLEDYKQKRQQDYDNRKLDKTSDFNEWLQKIEDTAIGKDQQEAIQKITQFIQDKLNASMAHIETLQRRMDQVNQSLSQIEYQERANEHIRKNFGTDIEQDEQAKIYKRKLETAIDEKAELDAAFRKFEAETKEQQKEIDESHKKELEELNKDHSELIEQLKNEKETLEKDNRKQESLAISAKKESDSNARKTGFKFAGVAALATAIVVGGCSMVTNHSKESNHNNKIDQQQEQIKKTNKKLDSQKEQLDKKDKEIQKQKDEAEKAKKAKDEAEKKSDKKSKKK